MTRKPFTMTVAALALAGLLGACSSGGGNEPEVASVDGEGSNEETQGDESGQVLFDWVECMNGEGVTLPEPTRDSDGDLVITGDGVNIGVEGQQSFGANSEDEMRAASDTCGGPPMAAPGVRSEESEREEQQMMLDFAQCMRDNGVEDFADPDFTYDPDAGGEYSPLPGIDESDPVAMEAAEACQDIMAGNGEGPTPG